MRDIRFQKLISRRKGKTGPKFTKIA